MSRYESLNVGTLHYDALDPAIMFPTTGNSFYVDSVNGSDGNDGSRDAPLASIPAGYQLLRANKNDVLYVMGGSTAYSFTSAFDWAKNYCHLIGIAAPCHNGGRVRLTMGADMATFFTVSARGCYFKNIHWQHSELGTNTNLTCLYLSYSGNACNVFEGCDIEGPLHATEAAAAFKIVSLASGTQDTTFRRCRIGTWTIQADMSSGYLVNFGGNNAVTVFEDCTFMLNSTSTGSEFINAGVNLGGESSTVIIKDCGFLQLDNDKTLTRAIVQPTHGRLIICGNSYGHGFTDWCATGQSTVIVCTPAANEAGGIGTVPA
jgi:hypothetical protein